MRIGIDARFLSHPQRGGFKTYTENLIMALSEVDDTNQYVVYLDRPIVDDHLPRKDNWHYSVVDGSFPVLGMVFREQVLLKKKIARDQLDLVHFLCNTSPSHMKGRYVVTLHDTIQIVAKNQFHLLRSLSAHKQWAIMAYSQWAINRSISSADRIVTVSNYEQKQISDHFKILTQRIVPIHLAPNPIYKPASETEKNIWRSDLPGKFGVQKKFILAVGYEPRKNIELLIETFGKLSIAHDDLDLVVVCAENKRRMYFQELAREFNLSERIHVLDSLPPDSLVVLYNLTEAFIFPSERESFGLPPLEAISCGAPTIVMKKTSLPEVLGEAVLFVEGKDVQSWAASIENVLSDRNLRLHLVDKGLKQAAMFTWHRCAMDTIQVYKDVLEDNMNYWRRE